MIRPNHYKHRDTAMCLRFSRDEKNLIEELAASEDCSRTDLIIFCVRYLLCPAVCSTNEK